MVSVNRIPARFAAIVVLLALPACTVTFRRKPIEPIDNDRNYDTAVAACWDSSRQAVTDFVDGIEDQSFDPGNQTGLLVTESYDLKGVEVNGDRATATIEVVSRLKHPRLGQQRLEKTVVEGWVLYEGQWYRAPGPVTFGDKIKAVSGTWVPPWAEENADDNKSVR